MEVKADLDAGRLDAAASKVGGLTGTIIGGVGASRVLGKGVAGAAGEVVGETAEAKALRVSKEVEVGTVAEKAAGGGKVLLAAEDCNAAGLKRLFEGDLTPKLGQS